MITTNGDYDLEEVKERIRQYTVKGVVLKTSVKKPYVLPGDGKKVALLDCGAKDNIARNLNKRGCEVPGAIQNVEDQTKIYIYSTINLYCSGVDIQALIKEYVDEEGGAEVEAGEEDIYKNADE